MPFVKESFVRFIVNMLLNIGLFEDEEELSDAVLTFFIFLLIIALFVAVISIKAIVRRYGGPEMVAEIELPFWELITITLMLVFLFLGDYIRFRRESSKSLAQWLRLLEPPNLHPNGSQPM